MRRLCKITLLIIIMTLTTATASADKYSRAWKKVEKFIEDDLPESAASEINHIWDMAAKDNDGRQMLKSAVYLTQVQQTYGENSIISGIELFSTLLPKLRVQEHKALCHAFLAKGYLQYWDRNKYRRNVLPTDEVNPPLQHWTAQMICDTICYHLEKSISLAGDVSSGYYQDFFPGGNKAGQKLRPLLMDMLMDNALVLVTDYRLPLGKKGFFDDKRLYGSMLDFMSATQGLSADDPDLWMFYVLRRLTEHNIAAKPDIRCTIDIRRFSILNDYLNNDGVWNSNDEEWLKGVVNLAQSYTKKVKFSTMFYSMAARNIVDNLSNMSDEKAVSLNRQAHDICIAAQKKWPKSEGAIECLGIKEEMERRNVEIGFKSNFLPGEHNIAKLKYRNLNTAYMRVVEVPSKISDAQDEISLLSQLGMANTVAEWSMRVDDPGDYLEHYAFIDIPPVMQGCYYLLVSSGPYFSSGDCISYEYVECNGIRFLQLVQNNGTLYGKALNTRTGLPVPNCKYTVWRVNGNGDLVKMETSGITPADGTITLEGLGQNRYLIEFEAGQNRGNDSFYVGWRSDMPDRTYARVFTDRLTYLPGDSILFSGVVYTKNSDNKGRVLADVPVTVIIDGDDDELYSETILTDSMGVFKGSCKIPENTMPGLLRIGARDMEHGTFSNYQTVNVESFRQPKFEVRMDVFEDEAQYNKPVTITGKAVSYTGVPVDGASVVWYAGASQYYCHRFCIPDERGNVRFGSGEVKTGPDGSFSFTMTVPGDIELADQCHVGVFVTVTDLNGETHDASIGLMAGKPTRRVELAPLKVRMDPSGQTGFNFSILSDNGSVSGRMSVKISRLEWPSIPGLELPFAVAQGKEKRELSVCADNQHLKERFPLYDFDFDRKDCIEKTVYEGTIDFDSDDKNSGRVVLDGLESGYYVVQAKADGAEELTTNIVLCRDDDMEFTPQQDLIWCPEGYGMTYIPSLKAEVGDTLDIRLGNSRKGTAIHYVIENKYGVYDQGMLMSEGRQQILSIPVTRELVGSFAVHMSVLYENTQGNLSLKYEVPDRSHELKMELVTFRDVLEPDEEEEWKIRITDWYGNPVTAAVMLDMYDKALDAYGARRLTFNPFSSVYIDYRNLISPLYNNSLQYMPWLHTWKNAHEYKGKRAITGTLLDPFKYYTPKATRGLMRMAKSANVVEMAEFEGLGITTADEVLQGSVAGLDIAFNTASLAEPQLEELVREQTERVALRSDLNPTGLYEYLVTDSNGIATVRFRAPQLLTLWKIQGIAFTDSLKNGRIDTTMITRKKIMVEPAAPRFLRQGDRMEFTAKVSNLSQDQQKVVVTLTITDAMTGKALALFEGSPRKTISIPAGGNAGVGFNIKVPAGLTAVTYRLTAQADGHSDGMQETIPVLSNRTQVVQSISLFNNGNETRTFRFGDLEKPASTTMADEQLTLEFSASPIWYAVQALPSMIRVDDPSNLRLMHSLMGAAISQNISGRYPAVREMLDEWAALPASEWQTQLEKNQKLTGTLLEETPWLRSSNNERDRLRSLAVSLGSEETAQAIDNALKRLMDAQMPDGGWPWVDGSPSSLHITDEILQGLGLLIENGALEVTPQLKEVIQKGLDYLDAQFYKGYNASKKPESLGYSELSYLMTRSYFESYPFKEQTRASNTYYLRLAEIQDTHDLNLYFRAQLALLMARKGKTDLAKHIAATLVERSLYNDEMGRYWRDNEGGLLWHEAPIETQALIIRTLLAVGMESQATEAARWLLKQRQTTGWCSSSATAAAVTALMATGGNVLLETDPDISIIVGKDVVKASGSRATAGYTTHTWQGPISRDKAVVTVESKTPGISWGAVYRSFTEELDKVEHSENGMSLKRTIWRIVRGSDGDRLEEVKPGTKVHVGDRLKISFELTTDRNLEYLQLSDMRAATFEPVSTRAGYSYNWRDDIGYYSAPGNTRNVFYIDRLSKGSYVIEYEVNVQKPGRFTVGNAVMQCLYAPAFRATTTSLTITVD